MLDLVEKLSINSIDIIDDTDEASNTINLLIISFLIVEEKSFQIGSKILENKVIFDSETFVNFLIENQNKYLNSSSFIKNLPKIFGYFNVENESKLKFLNFYRQIVTRILSYYKDKLEFCSTEFVSFCFLILEEIKKSSFLTKNSVELLQIIIKSIPRFFENLKIDSIRSDLLEVFKSILHVAAVDEKINLVNTYDAIVNSHFKNQEESFLSYLLISNQNNEIHNGIFELITTNIQKQVKSNKNVSCVLIIALINFICFTKNGQSLKQVYETISIINKTKFTIIDFQLTQIFYGKIEKEMDDEKNDNCPPDYSNLKKNLVTN